MLRVSEAELQRTLEVLPGHPAVHHLGEMQGSTQPSYLQGDGGCYGDGLGTGPGRQVGCSSLLASLLMSAMTRNSSLVICRLQSSVGIASTAAQSRSISRKGPGATMDRAKSRALIVLLPSWS